MAELRGLFAVLNLVRKRAKNKRFDLRDGFLLSRTVGHGSSQRGDLSDPSPVFFFFNFHLHEGTLPLARAVRKRVLLPNSINKPLLSQAIAGGSRSKEQLQWVGGGMMETKMIEWVAEGKR